MRWVCFSLLLASCLPEWQSPRCPTESLAHAKIIAGWHALFDGRRLDAWSQASKFEIVARELHADARDGIETSRHYRNFELDIEWRTSSPETIAVAVGGRVLWRLVSRAAGTHRILLRRRGLDLSHEGPAEGFRIETDECLTRARAPIGLRLGPGCTLKRVLVRETEPMEDRHQASISLFDGTGLQHWQAHLRRDGIEGRAATPEDVWAVRDGFLACRGEPWGYLYTKQKFTSFVLKLSWRFDPVHKRAGNSGVLLRMTGEHKVWPRSIEAQIKSGFAGDFWNIGEFPMQTVAARRYGRNTRKTHGAERPVGEWNEYEIIVDEGWVRLGVNGEVVNEAWNCDVLPGRICLQSEGAEIHIRNVTVIPLHAR